MLAIFGPTEFTSLRMPQLSKARNQGSKMDVFSVRKNCSLSPVNYRDTSQSCMSLMDEQQFEQAGFTGLRGSTG